ncbi:MAG: hypothetical protein JJE30_00470 [Desulfuromonadales bacterium]|nr:hypothetical protein [Desulfuromonadales bacterium]
MRYLRKFQKVINTSKCKLTISPVVLLKKGCVLVLFCLVTAILSPCFIEGFLFIVGEMKPKTHHSFHLSREIVSNNVVFGSISPINAFISLVERHYNFDEGFLKIGCSFLKFFSVRNAYGDDVANQSADACKQEIKNVVDTAISEITRHNNRSAFMSLAGAVSGLFAFIMIINRYG